MQSLRFLLPAALACLLAACGGGGGDAGDPPQDAPAVTFSFRMEGSGAEEEFRFATTSQAFIDKARAQLALPVAGRKLFPAGPIAAGSDGVNLNRGWHFTGLSLVETSIELCDGKPSMVDADLPYWLNTVKSFCPWGGYVYAEVTGFYTLRQFAVGQTREIRQEKLEVELKGVTDARCGAAQQCLTSGHAEVELAVRIAGGAPQKLVVSKGKGDQADQSAILGGYRFTLDTLAPYPVNAPLPSEQYRAIVTVQKLGAQ